MTRKILPTVLAIVLALLLSACAEPPAHEPPSSPSTTTTTTASQQKQPSTSSGATDTYITRDAAKAIALRHAGLADANLRHVESELDRERGITVYDVEFDHNGFEYDYTIHAVSGEILHSHKERDVD